MFSLPAPSSLEILGGVAALGSAAAWAVGSIMFRRIGDEAPPLGMNLGKGLIGLVLLGGALLLTGYVPMDARTWILLSTSGLAGIAAGDTFFFMALVRLEPRLTLLLATVGQAFTVVLAMTFLGERPAPLAWGGIVLILFGVTWVMLERSEDEDDETRRRQTSGIVYGLLAAVCMSSGIILAKAGLDDVSALQATVVRLGAGVAGLFLLGLFWGRLGTWLGPFRQPRLLRSIILAVLVIMFGGFYLSVVALKYTDASIATILNATEPLFILPLAVFVLGERLSVRAVLGAVTAVAGVALVLTSLGG